MLKTVALETVSTFSAPVQRFDFEHLEDDIHSCPWAPRSNMLKVLVLDCDGLARESMAEILGRQANVSEVRCVSHSQPALEILEQEAFDILFLEINMPEMTGLEMIQTIRERGSFPAVIFVTEQIHFAMEAFQQRAVDYILKPFTEERILEALSLARKRVESENAFRLIKQFPAFLMQLKDSSSPSRIALKSRGRFVFINVKEIEFLQADGNNVLLQGDKDSYVVREPLKEVERKLSSLGFFRIHKSVIVNASRVGEIRPWFTGEYIVKMKNGKEFTMTRKYKKNVSHIARLILGA